MSVKFFSTADEAVAFAKTLGAPARSLKVQCYKHKASNNSLYFVGLSTKASPADTQKAAGILNVQYDPNDMASVVNAGLGLEAGRMGRERWGEPKEGSGTKQDVVV